MKYILVFALILSGCASLPPLEKIEYNGPKLKITSDYNIEQMKSETIFMFNSPSNEKVLVNIYRNDGSLVGTLYNGMGGVFFMSLQILASKYDFDLPSGDYLIVLYGEKGKAGFKLKVM